MRNKILSIIIPVYNEENTISQLVEKVQKLKLLGIKKQIIIIDDGSTDLTKDKLKKIKKRYKDVLIIIKEKNEGKGSAVRKGIEYVKGDFSIIQDADLEYDPEDYKILIKPILLGKADVVYGSRFLGIHRAFLFWHYVANKMLNFITNVLYDSILTDMETCYKIFKSEILKGLNLKSKGFEIEPEITAKILKRKYKIYEVPISYYGRSYDEGKKITVMDAFKAVFILLKYRLF